MWKFDEPDHTSGLGTITPEAGGAARRARFAMCEIKQGEAALSGKSGRAKGPVNRTGRSIAGKPDQAS
ncbi:hypothetical protein NLM31_28945 [Bradyrhizobium sp. CCGUVB4N]|uniref:hypothetical protein n=1 Tax=Bradyrhizobium sp. CCGUVB4N TaxID=2949631 RepID=UPI0020B25AED|nr:hypothetical protein [Bradyrhizobium sp. CCGUVB4N]MCP3384404.1 hypothetical protein [Bradyrhizobium sp. CCGUVB4N]